VQKASNGPQIDPDSATADIVPVISARDRSPAADDSEPSLEETILSDIKETVYQWDVVNDELVWGRNAADVFGAGIIEAARTGSAFDGLVDSDSLTNRHQTVCNSIGVDYGNGVPYEVEYRLRLPTDDGDRLVWVQDRGRWYAESGGRPNMARGALRVIDPFGAQALSLSTLPDQLIPLASRAQFLDMLESMLLVAQHYKSLFALAIVAIDNLQIAGDVYGPSAIDKVARDVLLRLRGVLRSSDLVGQLADGQIGVIFKISDASEAAFAAGRIIDAVSLKPIETGQGPLVPMVSVGAVIVPTHAATVRAAVDTANGALDYARRNGPGHFAVHSPEYGTVATRMTDMRIADDLIFAINERRLAIARQPVLTADGGEVAFYECLVRLEREDGSLLALGDAIRVAEMLGLVRMIDFRVMELVIKALKDDPDIVLSFNVSVETAADEEWLIAFEAALVQNPGFAERLIVEMTETALIRNIEKIRSFVVRLRKLGCRVAIDDFGAGYTSFRNLKLLQVDMVKIDGSFIRNLTNSTEDEVFVRTLLELARNFNLDSVAEMVEDEGTAAQLRKLGVTYLQGFHLGMPVKSPGSESVPPLIREVDALQKDVG
jgi:diguanylate cyclase (GGDEF)-like protein